MGQHQPNEKEATRYLEPRRLELLAHGPVPPLSTNALSSYTCVYMHVDAASTQTSTEGGGCCNQRIGLGRANMPSSLVLALAVLWRLVTLPIELVMTWLGIWWRWDPLMVMRRLSIPRVQDMRGKLVVVTGGNTVGVSPTPPTSYPF